MNTHLLLGVFLVSLPVLAVSAGVNLFDRAVTELPDGLVAAATALGYITAAALLVACGACGVAVLGGAP